MFDEIFKFESFINFVDFFEIFQDPLFEIFIEISYFNYNSPIIRKKCQSSLTKAIKASGWKSSVMILPLFYFNLIFLFQ